MTKKKLQNLIDTVYLPIITYHLDKVTKEPYARGYAKDEKGWYVYEVDGSQNIVKGYCENDKDFVELIYDFLQYDLMTLGMDLIYCESKNT